eukprot:TRINITY_DN50943_c0_g1_i1.p1 TRINITY_DN50943_c0_g1~~TRINITY_DN50943_c0_g1_i1.p1  ORF type:complete len:456 (+),score=70.99 TRINITY_DN50943_c0_g1_i1:136-1503(+)
MLAGLRTRVAGVASGSLPAAKDSYEVGERVQLLVGSVGPTVLPEGAPLLYGTIVRAPSADGRADTYAVEVFAPDGKEGDSINPLLLRRIVDGLRAVQIRAVATVGEEAVAAALGAVGRPGSTMCSVPLVPLHRKSLGGNATGCSARLGGLGSRIDLNGLTCTVICGPNSQGQYNVELSLDEGEQSIVIVRPECLTLRLRRSALGRLLSTQPADHVQARSATMLGEVVEPDPRTSLQGTRLCKDEEASSACDEEKPQSLPVGYQRKQSQPSSRSRRRGGADRDDPHFASRIASQTATAVAAKPVDKRADSTACADGGIADAGVRSAQLSVTEDTRVQSIYGQGGRAMIVARSRSNVSEFRGESAPHISTIAVTQAHAVEAETREEWNEKFEKLAAQLDIELASETVGRPPLAPAARSEPTIPALPPPSSLPPPLPKTGNASAVTVRRQRRSKPTNS